MAIAPINYATIQRTADIETFKNQQDTKPMVDQQNIQVQVDHREDVLHHQVIHPEENEQLDNHTDAREEGKNKYKKQGSVTLILVGIIFVLVSFFVQEKLTPKDVQEITRLSEKELKIIVERELKNANDKVEDAIDAVVEQSQENAKRLMEKETNEKIMAINEYSNTVIESMNKTHNEILFLYNMLNDKHTELTGLASQLQQFSEQVKHTQDEMMTHLTETVKEPEPARTEVSEPVEEQPQQISPKASVAEETDNGSFNDQVLALHQNGVSDVEIARKLGRGLGEVKLVIGLYKGEDVSEI